LRASLLWAAMARTASQTCPNSCSKHGYCDTFPTKNCKCFEGWTGHDCGLRSCPTGPAWVAPAIPGEYGRPHERDAVCSGVGDCDRTTGRCACQAPFTGGACQKLDCPLGCSGAGTCVSLREAGLRPEWRRRPHAPTRYDEWDADTIFGCACNEWAAGFACEDDACPAGDDPVSPGVAEVQAITCACPGGCTGGSFAVSLGQGREVTILAVAVATAAQESSSALVNSGAAVGESVASRLAGLWGLPAVSTVTFSGAATTACGAPGETTITMTLLKRMGDATSLYARAGTLVDATGRVAAATAVTVTQGTTESVPCSGRGTCDRLTGFCECDSGFYSSDGNGGPGGIPNCGSQTDPYNTSVTAVLTQCSDPACNKLGICSGSPGYTCKCFPGWTGPTCRQMTCPLGPAWFSVPTGALTPHGLEVCSGAGRCSDTTGRCTCYAGFSGNACQRLACPSLLDSVACSGHGKCASLREMADAATANGIPYGMSEVQSIKCTLTAGTFVLYSGTHGTLPIAASATPAALQAALEALPFISLLTVRVHPYSATTICSASGTMTTVTFTSDTGNQPPLEPALSGGAVGTVTVTETVAGTRRAYGNDRGMVGGSEWDADAIAGCMCDRYGYANATNARDGDGAAYTGVSCTLLTCPFGQLPNMDGAVPPNVQEVQRISCSASSGSFTLSFRQSTTGPIPAGANAEAVVAALQGLPSVGLVSLTKVAGWATGSAVCNPFGEEAVSDITFVTELGDVPLLVADGYRLDALGTVTTEEQVKGIGLLLECSGKGKCNRVTGVCACDKGWFSSDGLGGLGQRGDCGSFSTESFGFFK
jgi:hypothetical protein